MAEPRLPSHPVADTRRMKAVLVLCTVGAFALAPFASPPFTGYVEWPVLPVQPAGYAFAIWGPIYLGLVVLALVRLIGYPEAADWDAPSWPLIVSTAIGAGWLAAAVAAPVLSVLMIVIMWLAALMAQARLRPGASVILWLPLGLYAGWLTAASGVAVGSLLLGVFGFAPEATSWAVLGLVTLFGLGVITGLRAPPLGYAAALLWALWGVIVGLGEAASGATGLRTGAAAAILLLGVATLRRVRANRAGPA